MSTRTIRRSGPLSKPLTCDSAHSLVHDLVESVCQLSQANRLTGIWDNRRFQECKKSLEDVDHIYVYKSEKLSRSNVEKRAYHRNRIEYCFQHLVNDDTPDSQTQ